MVRRLRRASTRHPFSHSDSRTARCACVCSSLPKLHFLLLSLTLCLTSDNMETVDIARLKSGEVNLGVSCPFIILVCVLIRSMLGT